MQHASCRGSIVLIKGPAHSVQLRVYGCILYSCILYSCILHGCILYRTHAHGTVARACICDSTMWTGSANCTYSAQRGRGTRTVWVGHAHDVGGAQAQRGRGTRTVWVGQRRRVRQGHGTGVPTSTLKDPPHIHTMSALSACLRRLRSSPAQRTFPRDASTSGTPPSLIRPARRTKRMLTAAQLRRAREQAAPPLALVLVGTHSSADLPIYYLNHTMLAFLRALQPRCMCSVLSRPLSTFTPSLHALAFTPSLHAYSVVKTAVDISGFMRSVGSELEGQTEVREAELESFLYHFILSGSCSFPLSFPSCRLTLTRPASPTRAAVVLACLWSCALCARVL
eukprot:361880-Chlamydomonas_euryale.AAC.17